MRVPARSCRAVSCPLLLVMCLVWRLTIVSCVVQTCVMSKPRPANQWYVNPSPNLTTCSTPKTLPPPHTPFSYAHECREARSSRRIYRPKRSTLSLAGGSFTWTRSKSGRYAAEPTCRLLLYWRAWRVNSWYLFLEWRCLGFSWTRLKSGR